MPETLFITLCLLTCLMVATLIGSFTLAMHWSRAAYHDNYRLCARRIRKLVVANVALGLLSGVLTITAMLSFNRATEDEIIVAVLCGVLSIVSLVMSAALNRIAIATADFDAGRIMESAARDASDRRTLRVLLAVGGLILLVPIGIVAPWLLILIGLATAMVWPFLIGVGRHRRPTQLLWLLSVAMRNNRSLANELRAHAHACGPTYATRLYRVAKLLDDGLSLGTALRDVRSVLPPWMVTEILVAEEAGTLAETLPELAKQQADNLVSDSAQSPMAGNAIYFAAAGWIAALICTFLMVFIIPKFKAIFAGFGTELPKMTQGLIQVSDAISNFGFITAPVVLVLTWVMMELVRADSQSWKNLRTRWLKWLYPMLDGPDVLRHLARATASGQSLLKGLSALSHHHFRPTTRNALVKAQYQLESGADCWEVLQSEGLLGLNDLQLVRSASQVGNLPWALRELAALRERRFQYRVRVIFEYLQPVPTLMLGVIVFFVVVPLFLPMVKLLNDLS